MFAYGLWTHGLSAAFRHHYRQLLWTCACFECSFLPIRLLLQWFNSIEHPRRFAVEPASGIREDFRNDHRNISGWSQRPSKSATADNTNHNTLRDRTDNCILAVSLGDHLWIRKVGRFNLYSIVPSDLFCRAGHNSVVGKLRNLPTSIDRNCQLSCCFYELVHQLYFATDILPRQPRPVLPVAVCRKLAVICICVVCMHWNQR